MDILLNHPVRCFVIAIALQTAGALLLIVNIWGKTRTRIIDMYFSRGVFANKKNRNFVRLNGDRVRRCVLNLYLNRVAFIYIALGYFLGIFGEPKAWGKDALAAVIAALSVLLVLAGYFAPLGFARQCYKNDMLIHAKEVPNDVEIIPTEEELKEEVDSIFKE